MAPPALLGPPELYTTEAVATASPTKIGPSFLMPLLGLTKNGSATYLSTGNPCLDFFFHVVPDTPTEQLIRRLESAWNDDPLVTLKLICNLRGVRGTGKSDKEGFYTAALWLHEHHPKTLACNLKAISDFGYIKDSLEILYRLLEGSEIRKIEKEEWVPVLKLKKPKSKSSRLEKTVAKAKKAVDRYNRDSDYQYLHDRISSLFAELLKADLEFYNEGKLNKISLTSKWCPSLDSSYDRATLMCESIARKLFPRDDFIEYQDIEESHYAYRVRNRLHKEVLVPLYQALELPEVFICANKWDKLPYERKSYFISTIRSDLRSI